MKKPIKTLLSVIIGIFFTGITGVGLLICMVNGIAPYTGTDAKLYLIKCAVIAFALPAVLYGLLMWNCRLLGRFMGKEAEHEKVEDMDPEDLIPCLVSALTVRKSLTEADKKELEDYLEGL